MPDRPLVLVTGGAGFIGSHVCVELLLGGYDAVVIDDLSNSHVEALRRVEQLGGRAVEFHRRGIHETEALLAALAGRRFAGLLHFAGRKVVSDSVTKPLDYYEANVGGSAALFRLADALDCRRVVFSSTASVYGAASEPPFDENAPLAPSNPYGRTKLVVEGMLSDLCGAGAGWSALCLRYFNPVGAHPSGRLGEDPLGVPTNLFPVIAQAAVGRRDAVTVFGDDYPTPDGTGVRDFIHVVDLARAHIAGLAWLERAEANRMQVLNVGTGRGYSVLEAVRGWEQACGRGLAVRREPRRAGDVAYSFANPALANRLLGWHAEHDLQTMCADHWRWQQGNPGGYT